MSGVDVGQAVPQGSPLIQSLLCAWHGAQDSPAGPNCCHLVLDPTCCSSTVASRDHVAQGEASETRVEEGARCSWHECLRDGENGEESGLGSGSLLGSTLEWGKYEVQEDGVDVGHQAATRGCSGVDMFIGGGELSLLRKLQHRLA